MRRRFFVDQFDSDSAILRGDAAEHLGRVLRAEPGQLYELSDGNRVWLAQVERAALSKHGDSRIEFKLVEPVEARESLFRMQVYISIVKFDRFEWCIEKATELGASEIIPLAAARSDKPLVSAAGKRLARWQKIAVESAQQARRLRPPIIQGTVTPGKAFAGAAAEFKIMLSERAGAHSLRAALDGRVVAHGTSEDGVAKSAALAIGPEGGWTDDEIVSAREAGFAEASLGENILRTETAVLSALTILRYALGE